MHWALAACCTLATLGSLQTAAAQTCPFDPWTTYQSTQLYRSAGADSYFFSTEQHAVDADGAPDAYHPDDVGKPCNGPGRGLDCPANAGLLSSSDGWKNV